MKRYKVTLTGETALLMHNDYLSWADVMNKWRLDPANKGKSVAGDDRTPAWRWIGSLYHDSGKVAIPSDNLMTVLREGGKKIATGKGIQTFKSQTQSGILVDQAAWVLMTGKGEVPYDVVKSLIGEEDFSVHEQAALDLGFELFVKRAKIGSAKHVRVRPRFDVWSVTGSLTVIDDAITTSVLETILQLAGTYCGIGDWRPSSPKAPGPFGKFSSTVKEIK
jgi:hypothetical protein